MLAEVIPEAYSVSGHRVFEPGKKRHRGFRPTFPMGRYVTQPLSVRCASLEEVRAFLKQCRYVTDQQQFDRKDYWMPPQEFEQRKQGDCDDFALWVRRQLMAMGYEARFVTGRAGIYGSGHAWVTMTQDGRTFIVEPMLAWLCPVFPRLSTMRYEPYMSVRWDGERIQYYEHERNTYNPTLRCVAPLAWEWAVFWIRYCPRIVRSWAKRGFLRIKRGVDGARDTAGPGQPQGGETS